MEQTVKPKIAVQLDGSFTINGNDYTKAQADKDAQAAIGQFLKANDEMEEIVIQGKELDAKAARTSQRLRKASELAELQITQQFGNPKPKDAPPAAKPPRAAGGKKAG